MTEDKLKEQIRNNFLETSKLLAGLGLSDAEKVITAGKMIAEALQDGGKILACGNGGSAADAQHFTAEFVGRFYAERGSLPAMSLSVDPSAVTAIGNDYGFEALFARQIEGLGREGDVLVVISTSGKSANILAAIAAAKQKNIRVIALVGGYIDEQVQSSDLYFSVLSSTPRIQEVHIALLHSICECVENLIS